MYFLTISPRLANDCPHTRNNKPATQIGLDHSVLDTDMYVIRVVVSDTDMKHLRNSLDNRQ